MNVVSQFELFDHIVLLRMKLPSLVGQSDVGPFTFSPHDTQSHDPSPTQETLIPPLPGFSDVYYNSVSAQINELKF